MNNAWLIIPRLPCVGFRSFLRPSTHHVLPPLCTKSSQFEACRSFSTSQKQLILKVRRGKSLKGLSRPQPAKQKAKPSPNEERKEKAVRITNSDIKEIFGDTIDLDAGTEVLNEIQKRRVTGSLLDLGLTQLKVEGVKKEQKIAALEWLRQKFPVDESTAAQIFAEDEEIKWRKGFERRALNSWFYKKNENVVEEDEVEHLSESERFEKGLGRWREMKEAKWKEQKKELKKLEKEHKANLEILALQAAEGRIELAEKRDAKIKRMDELAIAAELKTDRILDEKRSTVSRLGPSLAFGSVIVVLSLLLLNRDDVRPPDRVAVKNAWDVPSSSELNKPSILTCAAITAVNLAVFFAWRKSPRAWHYLNRYFMLSAGDPRPFSIVGAMFSHQYWIFHLATNSATLFALGMPLYDEIGRQNFLATYLGAGALAACGALTFHVLRRNFLWVSIGASGALFGVMGAFCTITPQRELHVPILDEDFTYQTWWALALFVALEVFVAARTRVMKYDHTQHLVGLMTGSLFGLWLRPEREADPPETPATAVNTAAKFV